MQRSRDADRIRTARKAMRGARLAIARRVAASPGRRWSRYPRTRSRALSQPDDVDINEILFRLTKQEY
jgi:hypothetical protein